MGVGRGNKARVGLLWVEPEKKAGRRVEEATMGYTRRRVGRGLRSRRRWLADVGGG